MLSGTPLSREYLKNNDTTIDAMLKASVKLIG